MGQSFAEKALARAAGRRCAAAGEVLDVRPDRVLSHDNTAAIARLFHRIGATRVLDPEMGAHGDTETFTASRILRAVAGAPQPLAPSPRHRVSASPCQVIEGRAWKYGDDVNTDAIFPGKYTYTLHEDVEMARHALEDLDPRFAASVRPGDIIVAGQNWGSGSSREQAVTCLLAAGVRAVIAASFARIYYRNAVNNGLLPIVCPEAAYAIQPGETVRVDWDANEVRCAAGAFTFSPAPESVRQIIAAGGLLAMLRQEQLWT